MSCLNEQPDWFFLVKFANAILIEFLLSLEPISDRLLLFLSFWLVGVSFRFFSLFGFLIIRSPELGGRISFKGEGVTGIASLSDLYSHFCSPCFSVIALLDSFAVVTELLLLFPLSIARYRIFPSPDAFLFQLFSCVSNCLCSISRSYLSVSCVVVSVESRCDTRGWFVNQGFLNLLPIACISNIPV